MESLKQSVNDVNHQDLQSDSKAGAPILQNGDSSVPNYSFGHAFTNFCTAGTNLLFSVPGMTYGYNQVKDNLPEWAGIQSWCQENVWDHFPDAETLPLPTATQAGLVAGGVVGLGVVGYAAKKTCDYALTCKKWLIIDNPWYKAPAKNGLKANADVALLAVAASVAAAVAISAAPIAAVVLTKAFVVGSIAMLAMKVLAGDSSASRGEGEKKLNIMAGAVGLGAALTGSIGMAVIPAAALGAALTSVASNRIVELMR